MRHWQKVTMIMVVLASLLAAGSIVSHRAVAQQENAMNAITAAQAALDKANQMYANAMSQMNATNQMPMSANEKAMMKTIGLMADTIKNLIEVNRQLILVDHEMNHK